MSKTIYIDNELLEPNQEKLNFIIKNNNRFCIYNNKFNYLVYDFSINPDITYIRLDLTWSKIIINPDFTNNINLEELYLPNNFNEPLDLSLNHALKKLSVGEYFNHSLDGKLPESLEYLKIGKHFDHPFDNLPNSLLHITIHYKYKHKKSLKVRPANLRVYETGKYNGFYDITNWIWLAK